MKSESYKLGKDGEQAAANYLKKRGYTILDERWHLHHLELDLIAIDNETQELVFVEVKTRASREYGLPEQAVDARKMTRCVNAADAYIKQKGITLDWRFDIISVVGDGQSDLDIEHIREAFYPPLG